MYNVNTIQETRHFNSHARVGRDNCRLFRCGNHANFNSHARVGRDKDILIGSIPITISTHTPV